MRGVKAAHRRAQTSPLAPNLRSPKTKASRKPPAWYEVTLARGRIRICNLRFRRAWWTSIDIWPLGRTATRSTNSTMRRPRRCGSCRPLGSCDFSIAGGLQPECIGPINPRSSNGNIVRLSRRRLATISANYCPENVDDLHATVLVPAQGASSQQSLLQAFLRGTGQLS